VPILVTGCDSGIGHELAKHLDNFQAQHAAINY